VSSLLLAHRDRIGCRQRTARAELVSPLAGQRLQDPPRRQPPQHPVERNDGLADIESLAGGDRLCAAPLPKRRLEPRFTDDLEHQAIDELVVQEVRPEERGVKEGHEIRRKHRPQQRRARFRFGVS
jgi:hypothetical protein